MTGGRPAVSSETIIYCDMDGVLVDFAPAAVDLCTRILDDSIDSETYLQSNTIKKAPTLRHTTKHRLNHCI